jgi:hypothetical protein
MAKITLGQRPKTFSKTVSFPMLDGTTGQITVKYRYRTRKEYGSMVDQMVAEANKAAEAAGKAPQAEFSMEAHLGHTSEQNAAYILVAVESWDLDKELSADTAQELADELPAAALAIIECYRAAITEGRLGN